MGIIGTRSSPQPGARGVSPVSALGADPAPWPDDWLAVQRRLVILHHGEAALSGQLLDALIRRGIEPRVVRSTEAGDLPDPASTRAAIVMGSARFDDAAASGYLDAELDWLRRADHAGTSVLAVGHGARALTVALGGRVAPAERPLRGWVMVDTTLPHLIPTGPWLTWQHDVIAVPPRAEVLAYNRLGPQAFRLGAHLAVLFHPEATPHTVAGWATAEEVPADARAVLDVVSRDPRAAASCARRLFSTFLNTIDWPRGGSRASP